MYWSLVDMLCFPLHFSSTVQRICEFSAKPSLQVRLHLSPVLVSSQQVRVYILYYYYYYCYYYYYHHHHHHYHHHHRHHNHHLSIMELGHLLTCSGLTYPEVSSKVSHDSFCQLGIVFHYPR
jgi:hypothetical protein